MTVPTASIRVLHVDDDPDFASMAADFLEREDDCLEVVTATSADRGIARLAEGDFDCVVSDYDMPGGNGIEFLQSVREDYPDLPFVLFTGKGSEEIASEAISAGVTDYLHKETTIEQYTILANRIRNVVDRYESERGRRRWKRAIETATDGIAIIDSAGEYAQMNDAYADVYDASTSDMIGTNWREWYPDDEIERFESSVLPELHQRGRWTGESVGIRVDGTRVEEALSLSTLDDGGHVCVLQDVTERSERERAIGTLHVIAQEFMKAETRERVAEIAVDAVRDVLGMPANAVHLYDGDVGGLAPIAWTDRGEEIVGDIPTFYPGESIAWGVFETGEIEAYDDVSTAPGRLNPETAIRSEIILPLGRHGVLDISSTDAGAFDDVDVSLARTLAAHTETALDRIGREASLREERALFERVLDTSPVAIVILDTDGTIQRANERAEIVLGLETSALTGRRYNAPEWGIVDEDGDPIPDDELPFGRVIETGESVFGFEHGIEWPDGSRRWLSVNATPLESPEGEIERVVAIISDVSEQHEYERAIENQNEQLEAFASIVSHDLRNPLNVLSGSLELAEETDDQAHFERGRRAIDRMRRLIDELLELARSGEVITDVESVHLRDVARTSWQNVETVDATLRVETAEVVRADETRLKQLLENLFRNAVQHGGETVTVTVGVFDDDDGFYFEDDGPGIPVDERDRVFESGYSSAEDGTGFGLSIVEQIASGHGWDVRVTDGSDGGARFEFTGVGIESS